MTKKESDTWPGASRCFVWVSLGGSGVMQGCRYRHLLLLDIKLMVNLKFNKSRSLSNFKPIGEGPGLCDWIQAPRLMGLQRRGRTRAGRSENAKGNLSR